MKLKLDNLDFYQIMTDVCRKGQISIEMQMFIWNAIENSFKDSMASVSL